MHQSIPLHRRVPYGALVRLERSAAKVARCVLRGEGSREAPDLPGGGHHHSGVALHPHFFHPIVNLI